MEGCPPDVEDLHLGIADLDPPGIDVLVEIAVDLEAGFSGGRAEQADDGEGAARRPAAPVQADEREQAKFDAVPFAGAGLKMADHDLEAELSGELPQPHPGTVRAAAVGGTRPMPMLPDSNKRTIKTTMIRLFGDRS